MKKLLIVAGVLLALQGCSSKDQAPSSPMATEVSKSAQRGAFLAYEHQATIDAPEASVKPLLERLTSACEADRENACVLLGSGMGAGFNVSAHVRMRLKPAGVAKMIALAASGGEVSARSTTTEDLAAPVHDSEKRIAMLQDYREKLQALEAKPGTGAESLIKVAQELARVQSELEDAQGKQAKLMERIQTDLLQVSIQSHNQRSFWSPVRHALGEFGSNLSQGIASAIVGMAYIVPWAILLFTFWLLARKLWRRLRK